MSFCSLTKGIPPKMSWFCLVLINSVLFNLLCVFGSCFRKLAVVFVSFCCFSRWINLNLKERKKKKEWWLCFLLFWVHLCESYCRFTLIMLQVHSANLFHDPPRMICPFLILPLCHIVCVLLCRWPASGFFRSLNSHWGCNGMQRDNQWDEVCL